MFVLDEADEMLSRGFKDQIYDVFRKLPSSIQVVLLSATMPTDVLEVTKRFMRDPVRILVKKEELTLEGIKQFYVQVEKEVRHWPGVDLPDSQTLRLFVFLGVEVGHSLRFVRDSDHHTSCHLCQYTSESGLAHREDAFQRLYRVCHGECLVM